MTETTTTSTTMQISLMPDGWVCRDTGWVVYQAAGDDAAKFLHGQLSQDVEHLDAHSVRWGGFCTAKGRLLATLVYWRDDQDGVPTIRIALPEDLAEVTMKRLSMFVLRAKCKISKLEGLRLTGVGGMQGQAWLDDQTDAYVAVGQTLNTSFGKVLGVPSHPLHRRFLIVSEQELATPDTLVRVGPDGWRLSGIDAGAVTIYQATRELHVPQMVNLDLIDGVNFNKGCYPGQEIVARSHYLGKLKRRMYRFVVDGLTAAPALATEIWSEQDSLQASGSVVDAAMTDDGLAALLVDLPQALVSSPLHLGSVDGPALTALPLPYDVPVREA